MDINKLKRILSDEAFVRELAGLEDNAVFHAVLKEKDPDLTAEQIQGIWDFQAKVRSGEITAEHLKQMASGEVPDELLEYVSGGVVTELLWGLGFVAASAIYVWSKREEENGIVFGTANPLYEMNGSV